MRKKVHDFATDYTAAWCSQQPIRVAEHFAENGSLKINDGAPSVESFVFWNNAMVGARLPPVGAYQLLVSTTSSWALMNLWCCPPAARGW